MRLLFAITVALFASLSFAQTPTVANASPPAKASKAAPTIHPLWTELKPEQQNALLPLQTEWPKISVTQKRKWIAVSKNFGKLKPEDQAKLHSRMREWVALTPTQRANARLTFSSAKTLSNEEKQKQWQAYQALSPEEKKKLQSKARANTPNSAALATKPQVKIVPLQPLSQPTKP
jgi:hypothetical protein